MIIDTSALVAVVAVEEGYETLRAALTDEAGRLPAPVMLEFLSVARGQRLDLGGQAEALLAELVLLGVAIISWTPAHAAVAAEAQWRYGKGNGRGGKLNLLDLMVYAVAIHEQQPLLFAGRDFTTTDVAVHPASRTR